MYLHFPILLLLLFAQTCGRVKSTKHPSSSSSPPPVYVPVLHASELGGGLLEVVVVAVGEGAQAARYQRHGAEAGTGLAGGVRAGGVLLAVLAVTRGLQPVVRACKGHLHGCWRRPLELLSKTNKALFASFTVFYSL